jgi:hypothetical protein
MSRNFFAEYVTNIKTLKKLVKDAYVKYRFYSDTYIRAEATEAMEFAKSIKFDGHAEFDQSDDIMQAVEDWLDIYNDYCIKLDSYMSAEARASCHNDAILDAEVARCFNVAQTALAKIDEQFVLVNKSIGIEEFCIAESAMGHYKNAILYRDNYKSMLADVKAAKKAAIEAEMEAAIESEMDIAIEAEMEVAIESFVELLHT